MTYATEYLENLSGILEKINGNQEQYRQTAVAILERVKQGGMIFPFGTGHGHLLALEMFYRAGGMMGVNPILTEELMLHKSATGSSAFERSEGNAEPLLEEFKVGAKDVVIVFSNSGINPLTIEMALGAKARGALTIALTNLNHSRPLQSRHHSGLKLYEICDIVLDNFGVLGDACVEVASGIKIAPTSTIAGAAIVHTLTAMMTELAEAEGYELELLTSGNVPNGHERNLALINKYMGVIKSLGA